MERALRAGYSTSPVILASLSIQRARSARSTMQACIYARLGALRARHLILGSIAPFFLEDDDEPQRWMISYRAGNAHTPADVLVGAKENEQMHRRATAVRDFSHHHTSTDVPDAEHELWHPNYLQAIATALDRLKARPAEPAA